jgi:hypothetical protein
MRWYILFLILIVFFANSCHKESEHQISTLMKFEQKPLAEVLAMATQQNKKVLVDFWSPG